MYHISSRWRSLTNHNENLINIHKGSKITIIIHIHIAKRDGPFMIMIVMIALNFDNNKPRDPPIRFRQNRRDWNTPLFDRTAIYSERFFYFLLALDHFFSFLFAQLHFTRDQSSLRIFCQHCTVATLSVIIIILLNECCTTMANEIFQLLFQEKISIRIACCSEQNDKNSLSLND